MANVSGGQPKYLMCARALALLTGLAGSATLTGSAAAASVPDGGPADADPSPAPYEGGVQGVIIMPPPSSGCGCDLGGTPVAPGVWLGAGLTGAGLIARRRRRSDGP